ncbi:sulfotransferase 1 family member D1-like [Dermacentor silvarum]|uniref:sulfotransferase 1 family member D1-like n=1 Tax=Dermacentor silvarum TaxID=543639 RepID=UPI00189A1A45|nr:sulfotransferase 1 family member D1-like [Dermacentor silvarum]
MPFCKKVQGVNVPRIFPDDAVISALSYEPREDDIFVIAYPKSGTTWVQCIAYGIFHDGEPPRDLSQFVSETPFLEFVGADYVGLMPRPGTIKTHLPFDEKRLRSGAKYIYVARNPYDVCVSSYYQILTHTVNKEDVGSFDEHLKRFVTGTSTFGSYLQDSLLPFYSRRKDGNVLFLTYETLCDDIGAEVTKIAQFLGHEYGRRISRDPAMLQRVIEMSSKERMRPIFKEFLRATIDFTVCHRSRRNASIPHALLTTKKFLDHRPPRHEFVRDGTIGNYKKVLSENQVGMLKEWISASTSDSDVMSLWSRVGLP